MTTKSRALPASPGCSWPGPAARSPSPPCSAAPSPLLVFRRGCFRAAGFGCPLGVREVMVRGCELSCGRVLAAGLVIWTIANLLMVLPSLRGHRIRLGHVLALQAGGFRLVNVRCPGVLATVETAFAHRVAVLVAAKRLG